MDDRRQSGLWNQNPQGVYERKTPAGPYQYYQPQTGSDHRRSFSERAAGIPKDAEAIKTATQNGLERSTSVRKGTTEESEGGRTHTRSKSEGVAPTSTHDDGEDDDIPENLRTKTWSPEPAEADTPASVMTALPPIRTVSNASGHIRRGSVPDRSPLQNLEVKFDNIGKEEKRARMEEAERRARDSSQGETMVARTTSLRSGKGRVVSDGTRRANDSIKRDESKQASAGAAILDSPTSQRDTGFDRFRNASNALRLELDNNRSAGQSLSSPTDSHSQRTTGTSAAYAAAGLTPLDLAAARGKAAHERRKSQALAALHQKNQQANTTKQQNMTSARSVDHSTAQSIIQPIAQPSAQPVTQSAARRASLPQEEPTTARKSYDNSWGPAPAAVPSSARGNSSSPERPRSKRLQKAPPASAQWRAAQEGIEQRQSTDTRRSTDSDTRHLLHNPRMEADNGKVKEIIQPVEPDIVSKEQVKTGPETAVSYQIPPQTAAARQAKERVTFAPDIIEDDKEASGKHHHVRELLHGHHVQARGYQSNIKPLEEWRGAPIARLSAAQTDLPEHQTVAGADRNAPWWDAKQSAHRSHDDAPYEEQAVQYTPSLYLKCGPLLRFTGLRRSQRTGSGASSWRGSVMILTDNASSDTSKPPLLRLFAQAADLYVSTSNTNEEGSHHNEDDPITGQIKPSRTGRPIYVRSVHDIQHSIDLSRQENNSGLFSATRPSQQTENGEQHIPLRARTRDGEQLGQYQEVQAHRLHVEHGCTFWRFNIEVELSSKAKRIAYRINNGPAIGFWVPAKGESMNIMFHSCNGFSLSVEAAEFCGPDPLWRDVLNKHQRRPFHVMIGGGDQIYNDAAIRDTTHFKEWLQIKNPEHKHHADFSVEMQEELEAFYFNRYAMWFSQGFFSMANAQIPMVNIYDDHDIIDGFGSYPHHFMSSPVFTGLGAIAFKYYMLFQHQTLPTETTKDEPSWLLGASPGPYINELNRSLFMWLGEKIALLAVDCRTERMRDEILSQESYDIIFNRCRQELVAGDSKHLIVLLGVPIAYPRLNFLENILTSRLMDPIKAIGRTGALGGFVNKFDGGVEILDDLDDHWTAKHHKVERNWFIQELQELAAEKSVRVTILGGDVHLGAIGQFYSNKKLGIAKDKDHRYMPNVISSAIVNTPPPPMLADVLNRRNKIHHLDKETDEDMIPMFSHDVDGSKRNNTHLLARRNYAILREYIPGTTPPPSPQIAAQSDNRYPPGSLGRSRTVGRGPGSLIRRLSLRGSNPPSSNHGAENGSQRPFSFYEDSSDQVNAVQRSNSLTAASSAQRPSFSFQRRPTNLSLKEARLAAAKGGPEAEDGSIPGHINLEHGLDISLCMEVDQHDPAGHTEAYRLLVPALWYDGPGDRNTLNLPARRPSLFSRMTGGRASKKSAGEQFDDEHHEEDDYDRPESAKGAQLSGGAPEPAGGRHHELEDLQATAAGQHAAPAQQRSAYHQRGYDLGAPPVGDGHRQHDQEHDAQHNGHYDYTDDQSDDRSYTHSEADTMSDEEDADPDARRQSKAERTLGIGENEEEDEAPLPPPPKKTGLKKSAGMWNPFKKIHFNSD